MMHADDAPCTCPGRTHGITRAALHSSGPRTETAERILAATQECIVEGGLGHASISRIATRAGVSRMTIYRYWDDFPAIVNALLATVLREILDTYGPREYTLDALVDGLVGGLDYARRHPLVSALAGQDRETRSRQLYTSLDAVNDTLRRALLVSFRRVARRDPRMRQDGLDLAVTMTLALIQGPTVGFAVSGGGLHAADWDTEMRRVLYGYLTCPPR